MLHQEINPISKYNVFVCYLNCLWPEGAVKAQGGGHRAPHSLHEPRASALGVYKGLSPTLEKTDSFLENRGNVLSKDTTAKQLLKIQHLNSNSAQTYGLYF